MKIPSSIDTLLWAALAQQEQFLSRQWFKLACAAYPLGAAGFSHAHQAPFTNPIGDSTQHTGNMLSAFLCTYEPSQELKKGLYLSLEDFMRIRAVQTDRPSEAVSVFCAMKPILHTLVMSQQIPAECVSMQSAGGETITLQRRHALLHILDKRIDTAMLEAVNAYCRCREQLAQITLDELKRKHSRILRFAEKYGESGS